TLPTLLLAQHFSSALKKSTRGIFAAVSAKVGSIEDNRLGGWYSYRASKAALNMALKTLSIEWQRSHKQLCVAALHPGTTDTGLSEPFQKNVPEGKLFTPEQTGHYLLNVLEQLTPEQTGSFFSWNGETLPW
ncbi:MAG: SDR family NAD(P)-dependent oxidoreductase, partial [Oceanospirillum sp.]|nr:SDR family NAD(P)-dependent oxidoreductase [Oceanospirillum sp.]